MPARRGSGSRRPRPRRRKGPCRSRPRLRRAPTSCHPRRSRPGRRRTRSRRASRAARRRSRRWSRRGRPPPRRPSRRRSRRRRRTPTRTASRRARPRTSSPNSTCSFGHLVTESNQGHGKQSGPQNLKVGSDRGRALIDLVALGHVSIHSGDGQAAIEPPFTAVAGLLLKHSYWKSIDAAPDITTLGTATGLGDGVTVLDPPHTSTNYLQTEMGFKIARRHAEKLRVITLIEALVEMQTKSDIVSTIACVAR